MPFVNIASRLISRVTLSSFKRRKLGCVFAPAAQHLPATLTVSLDLVALFRPHRYYPQYHEGVRLARHGIYLSQGHRAREKRACSLCIK